MMRIESLLERLQSSIDRQEWDLLDGWVFRVLYGQPPELQIDVARHMMWRYLPIYESHWPQCRGARQLLQDPYAWCRQFDREVPTEGDEWGKPGDAPFEFCFHALVIGCTCTADPLRLTSSCACAVGHVIAARMQNVWGADDPEAFEIMKKFHTVNLSDNPEEEFTYDESLYQQHISRDYRLNVAAQAVREREWRVLLEYLRQLPFSSSPVDSEIMEKHLAIWENRFQGLPIPPKAKV